MIVFFVRRLYQSWRYSDGTDSFSDSSSADSSGVIVWVSILSWRAEMR